MRHIAMYVCAAQQLLAHYCSLQRSRMKCKSMSIIALMTRSRIQIYIHDGNFKSSLYLSHHDACVCKAATQPHYLTYGYVCTCVSTHVCNTDEFFLKKL